MHADAGPSSTRRRKMKEGVGGGDQSLVPAATGGTPPLPLPAGATVRYFPLHHQPPFTPYMSSGAFCLDLNNSHHHRQFSNPLLENLTISPPSKPFTSLLTGFDDQDAAPPIVRDHNAQIDQLIRNQVVISLVNHRTTLVRTSFLLFPVNNLSKCPCNTNKFIPQVHHACYFRGIVFCI